MKFATVLLALALSFGHAAAVDAGELPTKRQASPSTYFTAIRALNLDLNNALLGYVGAVLNQYGQYGITWEAIDALHVTLPSNATSVPFDIAMTGAFPTLGGAVGQSSASNDLNTGSYNYAYLAGIGAVPAGSAVVDQRSSINATEGLLSSIESALWTVDASTGNLTAHWVNSNGATPVTQIVYYRRDNVLCFTGDPATFGSVFGDSPRVLLQAVQIPTVV
ncbi:hypothetical protein PUNSTDRAFT_134954 [Punctularia strigosozonata HHB-11173 SS5]|uniref:uncharacterized protein n=1 Tax=Punctularia strigosozonata (strain HHB-11173) TaxID=741275 RepID=UPI00044183A1|nr:uncharacterized protein PUNSTDRAFT_134954 [Punctularia strigosozonata HHB-11173 SS5]EIN08581.1 hypothetical protein PUNSTDRAFT_134954 [Punctularia strigosozonata HHB-11173 SS5]